MATTMVALAVLMDGPRHGYDVKRTHDEWCPSGRSLAYGQVCTAADPRPMLARQRVAHLRRLRELRGCWR